MLLCHQLGAPGGQPDRLHLVVRFDLLRQEGLSDLGCVVEVKNRHCTVLIQYVARSVSGLRDEEDVAQLSRVRVRGDDSHRLVRASAFQTLQNSKNALVG